MRGLYAITDGVSAGLLERAESAIQGGATLIQYRDKSRDQARREREACALAELCARYKVLLIINDDVRLAYLSGAAGVHLGRDDASVMEARRQLGGEALIGVSCYNSLPRALQAQAAAADYVAFGAFFPSSTKPHAAGADIEVLRRAAAQLTLPIAAIGGIMPGNGAELIEAGADLLAVTHGVFGAPDVYLAAQSYTTLFEQGN